MIPTRRITRQPGPAIRCLCSPWHALLLPFMFAILFANSRPDTRVFGQTGQQGRPGQAGDPLPPGEVAMVGAWAIDQDTFFSYWPSGAVTEPTITAVDLSTGHLLWSKPANIMNGAEIRVDEGWLQYTTFAASNDSVNPRIPNATFHLVNGRTGEESNFQQDHESSASTHLSQVCRGRYLTPNGLVVSCTDGRTITDLGPGYHQILISGDDLFVMTLILDKSKTFYETRSLRMFDLAEMRLQRELEMEVTSPWRLVAVRGDRFIFRVDSADIRGELVCFDVSNRSELWRVVIPRSVSTEFAGWNEESQLILSMGHRLLIRPAKVDMETGAFSPDPDWHDPRLLLAWHQTRELYPDFVATNPKVILGRWRQFEVLCVDARSGKLLWKHENQEDSIGRWFTNTPELSDYFVVETQMGFDIVTVATGESRSITASDVGLTPMKRRRPSLDYDENAGSQATSWFGIAKRDWLWDWMLRLAPLTPLVVWLLWRMLPHRSPVQTDRKEFR